METTPFVRDRQNQLLSTLPSAEWDRLRPHLELIPMPSGRVICERGHAMSDAYFPLSCNVSLLAALDDGTTPEMAVIGAEGMVGVSAFMGSDGTSTRAVVKTSGHAYSIKAPLLQNEFNRGGVLQQSLLRYTNALMNQFVQNGACNRRHSVLQQLCRYLLTNLDRRQPSRELAMTHEMIASMLGVRREGVTMAAGKLQQAGCIRYARGRVTILDRAALEERTCECYHLIKHELERFAPPAETRRSDAVFGAVHGTVIGRKSHHELPRERRRAYATEPVR